MTLKERKIRHEQAHRSLSYQNLIIDIGKTVSLKEIKGAVKYDGDRQCPQTQTHGRLQQYVCWA